MEAIVTEQNSLNCATTPAYRNQLPIRLAIALLSIPVLGMQGER
jgi:hypothetical protein